MPGQAAISPIIGLAVGIAVTAAIADGEPGIDAGDIALLMAVALAAMVCSTMGALAALHRWINERTRQATQQVAIERSTLLEAGEQRAQELNDREKRLSQRNRSTSMSPVPTGAWTEHTPVSPTSSANSTT
ncbi:hypothetical protein ACWEQU_13725 [Streptomyces nodosus]